MILDDRSLVFRFPAAATGEAGEEMEEEEEEEEDDEHDESSEEEEQSESGDEEGENFKSFIDDEDGFSGQHGRVKKNRVKSTVKKMISKPKAMSSPRVPEVHMSPHVV